MKKKYLVNLLFLFFLPIVVNAKEHLVIKKYEFENNFHVENYFFSKDKPVQLVHLSIDNKKKLIQAAKEVLIRVLGSKAKSIKLEIISPVNGIDTYEYEAKDGNLIVKGSSVVALTRGAYDYLRSNNLGMLDWSGPQFHLPEKWPDANLTRLTSPFKIRQAYNVVTSGYTTPYWTWERWEKELDWQMMHGFNMLMSSVATEAIATRVWKKLGLTQSEIDEFYVGPAHLPWQRMGNIEKVGGTLPPEWHTDQIALQHKILKRMRELGIVPIIQSFAGFVPKALKRIYPNLELHNTLWNGGFTPDQRPVLMMPSNPLFAKITKMYMKEWQKEFGDADYYLVDSFNELELPKTDRPVTELLAEYGEKTFNAVLSGDENATWVIQGWMFGYQRDIWSPERIKALFSRVPNDRILILDYANDYANSWEPVNGFNGKQWVYGFVPNMGGKTIYTGDMSLYATGSAKTLANPKKNNLVGYSISGEGLENNTVLYELMTDAAWSKEPIDLDSWLVKYNKNRYGASTESLVQSWDALREKAYKDLIPHPTFGWQKGECRIGNTGIDSSFIKATKLFLQNSDALGKSKNFQADAIERVAISLGYKADQWFETAATAYSLGNSSMGDKAGNRGLEILKELDRLLESHPLDRLDRWIKFAKSHSNNTELRNFYESNARQIITVWGPPVNDYSCRVWSGLVRDFYYNRMKHVLESLKSGTKFDMVSWEVSWVKSTGISDIEPFANPLKAAQFLFKNAISEPLPVLDNFRGDAIGNWSSKNVSDEWQTLEWTITSQQLKSMKGITFQYIKGADGLDIKEVAIIADGKLIGKDTHIGFAGTPNKENNYVFKISKKIQSNNGCSIRAIIRTSGGSDSVGIVKLLLKKMRKSN